MKRRSRVTLLSAICLGLALSAWAGPEPISGGKEMKQVAPAPLPECNWTGFYIGLNVGGNFGHAENTDVDGYNTFFPLDATGKPWGYDASGVVAGVQVGDNFTWNWLVLGIRAEGGFMNIDGRAQEPDNFHHREDV